MGDFIFKPDIEGILQKRPYLPCVSMAGRALLAGYHRYVHGINLSVERTIKTMVSFD